MANKFHKTALISSKAKLGNNITVGAYSIIGDNVSLGDGVTIASHSIIDGNVSIGDNTFIANHVNITGNTTIGKNNKIYHFCSIGEIPQDKKYNNEATSLIIGNNNLFREYCSINAGTLSNGGDGVTRIDSNNWILAYCHIAHDCVIGSNVIFSNNAALAGHVKVKDWVVLGGYVKIHQFSVIGEHVMVGINTTITQDIPPCVMAKGYRAEPKGINSEGLKRRGFSREVINSIKNAYNIIYRNDMAYDEAKTFIKELSLEHEELLMFVNFFSDSTGERGIIR